MNCQVLLPKNPAKLRQSCFASGAFSELCRPEITQLTMMSSSNPRISSVFFSAHFLMTCISTLLMSIFFSSSLGHCLRLISFLSLLQNRPSWSREVPLYKFDIQLYNTRIFGMIRYMKWTSSIRLISFVEANLSKSSRFKSVEGGNTRQKAQKTVTAKNQKVDHINMSKIMIEQIQNMGHEKTIVQQQLVSTVRIMFPLQQPKLLKRLFVGEKRFSNYINLNRVSVQIDRIQKQSVIISQENSQILKDLQQYIQKLSKQILTYEQNSFEFNEINIIYQFYASYYNLSTTDNHQALVIPINSLISKFFVQIKQELEEGKGLDNFISRILQITQIQIDNKDIQSRVQESVIEVLTQNTQMKPQYNVIVRQLDQQCLDARLAQGLYNFVYLKQDCTYTNFDQFLGLYNSCNLVMRQDTNRKSQMVSQQIDKTLTHWCDRQLCEKDLDDLVKMFYFIQGIESDRLTQIEKGLALLIAKGRVLGQKDQFVPALVKIYYFLENNYSVLAVKFEDYLFDHLCQIDIDLKLLLLKGLINQPDVKNIRQERVIQLLQHIDKDVQESKLTTPAMNWLHDITLILRLQLPQLEIPTSIESCARNVKQVITLKRGSTFEKNVEKALMTLQCEYQAQVLILCFRVDFFIDSLNTILECDGTYHFLAGKENKQSRVRRQLLIMQGYRYITLSMHQWKTMYSDQEQVRYLWNRLNSL